MSGGTEKERIDEKNKEGSEDLGRFFWDTI